MTKPYFRQSLLVVLALCLSIGFSDYAKAQTASPNLGYQLNRYEPTAAGEWSFAVSHPWYSSTRLFSVGLTLDYAHKPLVLGYKDSFGYTETQSLIAHQFIGHLDLAASFLDRVLVTGSLPVVMLSRGTLVDRNPAEGSFSVGDPRFGVLARMYGQPQREAWSINAGVDLWVPLRGMTDALPSVVSDQSVRVLPKIVLAGVARQIMWSGSVGFLFRPEAQTQLPQEWTSIEAGRAASELQLGLRAAYFNPTWRFAVGPELLVATAMAGKDSFSRYGTSLEALLGGHYNLLDTVQLGAAVGLGFVRQPGTPDVRFLLRAAYAPTAKKIPDGDGDGIPDKSDACPTEKGVPNADKYKHGCPVEADRDADGVPDKTDKCPEIHKGPAPDPDRLGCPLPEKAPVEPDRDGDGVPDRNDLCPSEPQGGSPDPNRLGCPAMDSDKDGVLDPQDQCLFEPAGLRADPARPGCPLADKDHDEIPDAEDACPDKAGAPHPDKQRHGCPSLVEVRNCQLAIQQQIQFKPNSDVLNHQASAAVLTAVANALKGARHIKRVRIEGHTDTQCPVRYRKDCKAYNQDLSERRIVSVRKWLIRAGIEESRLEGKAYGQEKPIAPNNAAGRIKNRRVEFHLPDCKSDP
jgi:outer membrane protein OmpA-like peptidoglycan-associated protein